MTERLLQYIWQFQYFSHQELKTTSGDMLTVLHPGTYNSHQGPDFLEAKIRIAGIILVGNIELHVRASDWSRHFHADDPNYQRLLLHVVWRNDAQVVIAGTPTLTLEHRISGLLLSQYDSWMHSGSFIPCEKLIGQVDSLVWHQWQERLTLERLMRRSRETNALLQQNNCSWPEMLWWMIARSFGLYVNADAFEEVAKSLPYLLLVKHSPHILHLEAIILGQAGLLDKNFRDKYPLMLQKEYRFFAKKYGLQKIRLPMHFLRMRPPAFPTVRLAQLAMFLHKSRNLVNLFVHSPDIKCIRSELNVTANDYWHYHFNFDDDGSYFPKTVGAGMVNLILINGVIPFLYSYAHARNDSNLMERAIGWLDELPPERNHVVSRFQTMGITVKTAALSQSLMELKKQYCDKKRCLDCAAGNWILKSYSTVDGQL